MSAPYFHGDVMSKRDVLIAREAVRRTVAHFWVTIRDSLDGTRWNGSDVLAAEMYPLPRVTRPRVVADQCGPRGPQEFRFVDGVFQIRAPGEAWQCLNFGTVLVDSQIHGVGVTPERVALWADLIAHPTEEVEA